MIGLVWQYGSVLLAEYDEDGFLSAQIDAYGELESGMPASEAVHPGGFFYHPRDPDKEGAASCLFIQQGDQDFAFIMQDARAVLAGLVPEVSQGSSLQYAHTKESLPSFDVHDGEDGTKQVYVEYMDGDEKKAHLFTIGLDGNGKPVIELVHGSGMGLVLFEESAMLRNNAGDAYVEADADGVNINGELKTSGSAALGGDVKSGTSVSLELHTHLSAMGPTGPAIPSP